MKIATFLSTKESIMSDFSPVIINISKKALIDTNTPPDQKLPITAVILLLIRITLNFMLSFDFFFWAICLVAFYGTLASYIPT